MPVADFDWSALLSGGRADDGVLAFDVPAAGPSDDAFLASLLAQQPPVPVTVPVPALTRSEGASSGEDEPASPGHKRSHGRDGGRGHEIEGRDSRAGRATFTDRRRYQNRAAQRAFRERREKHVRDLEERVQTLEQGARAREIENDNLRDLVHQLRRENERIAAGRNRFAQSSFVDSAPGARDARSHLLPSTASHPYARSDGARAPPSIPLAGSALFNGMGSGAFLLAELGGPRSWSATPHEPVALDAQAMQIAPASSTSTSAAHAPDLSELIVGGEALLDPAPMDHSGLASAPSHLGGARLPAAEVCSVLPSADPTTAESSSGSSSASPSTETPRDDIDTLCTEMRTKATCQEYARRALELALHE